MDTTHAAPRESDWSALMGRAQDGDADAYRRLLGEIAPFLRALAARAHRDSADVEDCVQDALLAVHAARHTYDPRRPFGPWLVAIANRRITDRLRRQGRVRAREIGLEEALESAAAPQREPIDRPALSGAIASLPASQREAIVLLKLREMSLKEAAAMSGMTIPSLKVATHRAIRNLRKLMGVAESAQ